MLPRENILHIALAEEFHCYFCSAFVGVTVEDTRQENSLILSLNFNLGIWVLPKHSRPSSVRPAFCLLLNR
jgi:hypothetical protein